MKKMLIAAAAVAPLVSFAGLYGDIPDAKHAWSVHDENRPLPNRVTFDAKGVPSDAIVLFDGTQASLDANWCDKNGGPTQWQIKDGGLTSRDAFDFASITLGSVYTRREFGDCQLHIEFRHPAGTKANIAGNNQMRGNSGVFLMGQKYGYEIQVLESYYTCPEAEGTPEFVPNYADGISGAVYAENPPLVNALHRPGEWQTYDIVFHQPVWNGATLVHPGSVTVLLNGVLVQDAWEMEGETTHCNRRPLAAHPTAGPLMLQDHGCEVSFRNIWIRPLASRWANKTHSLMSADEGAVMAERRATAARLFAKIADPSSGDAATVRALAEVISYAFEGEYTGARLGEYKTCFDKALAAYRASKPTDEQEIGKVNAAIGILIRGGILKDDSLVK